MNYTRHIIRNNYMGGLHPHGQVPQEATPRSDKNIFIYPICDKLVGLINKYTHDFIAFVYKQYGEIYDVAVDKNMY